MKHPVVTENTKYPLRVANPRAADRPTGCWPPKGHIVMTSYQLSNHYPFGVCLIMTFTFRTKFVEGAAIVRMTCLGIGYPTAASVPHMVTNAFRNQLADAVETDYTFKEAEQIKE
jgi:hypothetical protein